MRSARTVLEQEKCGHGTDGHDMRDFSYSPGPHGRLREEEMRCVRWLGALTDLF